MLSWVEARETRLRNFQPRIQAECIEVLQTSRVTGALAPRLSIAASRKVRCGWWLPPLNSVSGLSQRRHRAFRPPQKSLSLATSRSSRHKVRCDSPLPFSSPSSAINRLCRETDCVRFAPFSAPCRSLPHPGQAFQVSQSGVETTATLKPPARRTPRKHLNALTRSNRLKFDSL